MRPFLRTLLSLLSLLLPVLSSQAQGTQIATAGTDAWFPRPGGVAPSARLTSTSVWTGKEFIIWGGVSRRAPPG